MKFSFDHMSEELDRNIELLKCFQMEKRYDLISIQVDKLKADQKNNESSGKKDKELSAQKEMEKLAEGLKQQQEQNFVNKSLPQNDIELIIQNILIISLSEEELLEQFRGVGSPDGKGEGYDRMKKYQNGLKKQLQDLISQMKNGEKGKPLQQGISNIIRENELFKKSLNDFISKSGSLSNSEKQLLNERNRLLDDNIRDSANYSVFNQVINRNNLIYNKLLMFEKPSKEREEFEEKRKSETAMDARYKRPDTVFNANRKSGLIKTGIQKSDLKLNGYFKTMYNNYYIKLGNE